MNKRIRQYVGLAVAILAYYVIHEGAHLMYALSTNSFRGINFMGLGIQIDVYADRLSETQLAVFCLVGSLAALVAAYVLVLLIPVIARSASKLLKACAYYVTIALLLLDPLYLSLLCDLFGGGDMNGISLLIPEPAARIAYGVILVANALLFFGIVLPRYKKAFADPTA